MKLTLFVDIESQYAYNPVARAIRAIAIDTEPIEQLVCGNAEADIAVTNSVERALRMVKETEHSSIILAYFGKEQRKEATAFASRYPDRVTAIPLVGSAEGEMEFVPFLLQRIGEIAKEA